MKLMLWPIARASAHPWLVAVGEDKGSACYLGPVALPRHPRAGKAKGRARRGECLIDVHTAL